MRFTDDIKKKMNGEKSIFSVVKIDPSLVKREPKKTLVKAGKRQPNQTEELYNTLMLDGKGMYEAISFRLPGGSGYKPDWIVFDDEGRITAHETKGQHKFKSHGRSTTAFRECVAHFPQVKFIWAVRDRDKFDTQEFNA